MGPAPLQINSPCLNLWVCLVVASRRPDFCHNSKGQLKPKAQRCWPSSGLWATGTAWGTEQWVPAPNPCPSFLNELDQVEQLSEPRFPCLLSNGELGVFHEKSVEPDACLNSSPRLSQGPGSVLCLPLGVTMNSSGPWGARGSHPSVGHPGSYSSLY